MGKLVPTRNYILICPLFEKLYCLVVIASPAIFIHGSDKTKELYILFFRQTHKIEKLVSHCYHIIKIQTVYSIYSLFPK